VLKIDFSSRRRLRQRAASCQNGDFGAIFFVENKINREKSTFCRSTKSFFNMPT